MAIRNGTDNPETVKGTEQADKIDAKGGDDIIKALGGNDEIRDGSGDDQVYAGKGNDKIINIGGTDLFDGGAGNDTFFEALEGFEARSMTIYFDMVKGVHGAVERDFGEDTIVSIENYTMQWNFNTIITGDDKANGIKLNKGNDKVSTAGGNDRIDAGGGNDIIDGGKGRDKLTGGKGKDKFVFHKNDGNDTITDFEDGKDKIVLKGFGFKNKKQALKHFYEIGSATDDKVGFDYKGTKITIKGADPSDIDASDIVI